MKKRWKIFILIVMFLFVMPIISLAEGEEPTQEEILKSQQDSLNISGFLEEAKKYTQDTFEDIDINDLFTAAITGNVDNTTILKNIFNIARKRNHRLYNRIRKYYYHYSDT